MRGQWTVFQMEVGEMTAFKAGSFSHPFSSLLSKEYKGIAGLPDKHNLLEKHTLRIIRQHQIWPFRQRCRFSSKANSTKQIYRPRTIFPATPCGWVAGYILHSLSQKGFQT